MLFSTIKIQFKLLARLEQQHPKVLTGFKYLYIFLSSLAASMIVNYYFQYFQMLKDPILTSEWIMSHISIYMAGVLYILFIFLLAYVLLGNLYFSSLITSFLLLAIGFIHYNKLNIRVEPLYFNDYKQIQAMKDVLPMITEYINQANIRGSRAVYRNGIPFPLSAKAENCAVDEGNYVCRRDYDAVFLYKFS